MKYIPELSKEDQKNLISSLIKFFQLVNSKLDGDWMEKNKESIKRTQIPAFATLQVAILGPLL